MNNLRNIPVILLVWGICAFQALAAEESTPQPPKPAANLEAATSQTAAARQTRAVEEAKPEQPQPPMLAPASGRTPTADEPKPKPPEPMTATLFPGETLTYQGVSVTWVVEPGEQRPKSDTEITTPTGHLKFVGPTSKLDKVPLPFRIQYAQGSYSASGKPEMRPVCLMQREFALYMDQALFRAGSSGGSVKGDRIGFGISFEEKEKRVDASPQEVGLYVSYSCPARINQWELTISEKIVRYPDGSRFFQITARNVETGEKVVFPATEGARKKAGRFDFIIHSAFPETRTVIMSVDAESDSAVRGRDAYAEIVFPQRTKYGEFLSSLTQKYGFEIEWVPYPKNQPESVEFAKNTVPTSDFASYRSTGTLGKLLKGYFSIARPSLELEWRDATHLRVWAPGYAKVAEEKKEKERKEADEKREEAEQSQDLEKLKALFYQKYSPVTKVYNLQNLGARTAKELLEPVAPRNYYLFGGVNPSDPLAGDRLSADPRMPLLEKGKYHFITAVPVEDLQNLEQRNTLKGFIVNYVQAQSNESVIADERSNSLIVSAVPQTHEKIVELLKQADQMIDTRAAAEATLRFRIEVVLLKGGKESAESAEGTPLSFPFQGVLSEIKARPGDRVKAGDVIARLDTGDTKDRYESLRLELDKNKNRVEAELRKLNIAKVREKAGVTEGTALIDADIAAKEAQSALAQNEIQLQHLQKAMDHCVLKSPADGTISWVAELLPGHAVQGGGPIARLIPASGGSDIQGKSAEGTPLSFQAKGWVVAFNVKPGDKVKAGDVIACLTTSYYDSNLVRADEQYKMAQSERKKIEEELKAGKGKDQTGKTTEKGLKDLETELHNKESRITELEGRIRELKEMVELCSPKAPSDGTITWVAALQPGEEVVKGVLMARFIPDVPVADGKKEPVKGPKRAEKVEEKKLEKKEPTLAERYGISAEDMQLLGVKSLVEVGRGVLKLSGDKGEAGRALVNLTPQYQCDLQYQDFRTPYLIARVRLQSPAADGGGAAKSIIENTVYLECGKPSADGVTNLSEALILVVQLHDMERMPPMGAGGLGGGVGGSVGGAMGGGRDDMMIPAGKEEFILDTTDPAEVQKEVGPITLRLRRVNPNVANDRADTCELLVNTPSQSVSVTLKENGPDLFVDDWRLRALDMVGLTTGEGNARIRVSYSPAGKRGEARE